MGAVAHPGLEARALVPLFGRQDFDRLAEGPDVAFGVAGAIGAVAIELRLRFGNDFGAGRTRTVAMRVEIFGQLDVHRLRALAADGLGRAMVLAPFGSDHDAAIAIGHLAVRDIAGLILDQHVELEAESALEEIQRCAGVEVAERGGDHWIGGHGADPCISPDGNISIFVKLSRQVERPPARGEGLVVSRQTRSLFDVCPGAVCAFLEDHERAGVDVRRFLAEGEEPGIAAADAPEG